MLRKYINRSGSIIKSVVLLIVAMVALILPRLLPNPYYLQIIIMVAVNIMLTVGLTMLLSSGLVTLGCAAFWAIGAYASTMLTMKVGLNFWYALVLSGILAGIIALATGIVIVRLSKIAFTFVTIMIGIIVYLVVGRIDFFGGWGGIVGIPKPDPISLPFNVVVNFSSRISSYYLIIFLLFVNILVFYALYNSRIGRAWKAIKLNPQLAESLGINTNRYALAAYIIAGIFAGIAGSFYAHTFNVVEPGTFGFWKSIYVQVYAILGGVNFYILGPVIGSIFLTLLPEILRLAHEIEPLITGCLLLIVVIFLPGGLLSLPHYIYGSASLKRNRDVFLRIFRRRNI